MQLQALARGNNVVFVCPPRGLRIRHLAPAAAAAARTESTRM